jgi:2-keto-myo-inositol isomerase
MTRTARREFLIQSGLAASAVAATAWTGTASSHAAESASTTEPFRYCFNTSTIREQKLGIVREVEIVAAAGYSGIEPWIRQLDQYVQEGGSLPDLKKRIADAGLTVESAIGFAAFLHEDPAERQRGLEEAKRSMDLVLQIGGTRIAAPPVGVTDKTGLDPYQLAERYRALCDLGQQMGVYPQLELWGFSKTLHRLGEVAFTGVEAAHPFACYLLDTYHIYKGGSDLAALQMFPGHKMFCFHINDYPADPPRATIADKDRVYPGDGVCPLDDVFRMLKASGYRGALSLELFNPSYWQQDAMLVAKTGLAKTRAAVQRAFS